MTRIIDTSFEVQPAVEGESIFQLLILGADKAPVKRKAALAECIAIMKKEMDACDD